jgi:N-acyl-D-aspartate/D-glutamate deacylase
MPTFGKDAPHPRAYGTFARVLGVYVREKQVLTLEEAIRKMASLPAQRMGGRDRGILRPGLKADLVVFNNSGIYRGTDVNPSGGSDVATTVFVKDARYDKMMEAFGGVGVHVTTPGELTRAVNQAMDSGRPTLINAIIDEKAGTESGRITSLNPTAKKA